MPFARHILNYVIYVTSISSTLIFYDYYSLRKLRGQVVQNFIYLFISLVFNGRDYQQIMFAPFTS